MPHLSPMLWSLVFVSSWTMLSTILMNTYKMKNKRMMTSNTPLK